MLDLSVSWNTSDPVYKKLASPDGVLINECAMTSDGEHLFALENEVGFIYNLKSDTWTEFNDNDLVTSGYAGADPETGFIYLPSGGLDSKGRHLTLSLDLRTKAVNKTVLPVDVFDNLLTSSWRSFSSWSAYLKGMVIFGDKDMNLFTPSNVSKSSTGWSKLKVAPMPDRDDGVIQCSVPAFGGTKLVLSAYTSSVTSGNSYQFHIYTLDLVTRTWKKGPPAPSIGPFACAVTGDQLILWGGRFDDPQLGKQSTAVFVYNMKTEKWTTKYTAPPSRSIMTTTSQSPTQHIPYTTITPDHSDVSSSEIKLTTIATIVTGSLIVIILTTINIYLGISKRSKVDTHRTTHDGSSFDSPDTAISTLLPKKYSIKSSRRRNPSESSLIHTPPSSDHNTPIGRHVPGVPGRLHQGSLGARELSEHPHAIVEDPTLNGTCKEAPLEYRYSQHPHATVGDEFISRHGSINNL
ncbi:hypothetical protein BGX34_010292 [Mortierella sp. NVP85]|nr:hypothetical protein BGX34_010292 [Mortierella sp. NVP85]